MTMKMKTAKEVLYQKHYEVAIKKGVSQHIAHIIAESLSNKVETIEAMEEFGLLCADRAIDVFEETLYNNGILKFKRK